MVVDTNLFCDTAKGDLIIWKGVAGEIVEVCFERDSNTVEIQYCSSWIHYFSQPKLTAQLFLFGLGASSSHPE